MGHNTCPVCRDAPAPSVPEHNFVSASEYMSSGDSDTNNNRYYGSFYELKERMALLRRQSRRVNAPRKLKKMVETLKTAEQSLSERRKNMTNFRRNNIEVFTGFSKIRKDYYYTHDRIRKLKRKLATYDDIDYPNPFLNGL